MLAQFADAIRNRNCAWTTATCLFFVTLYSSCSTSPEAPRNGEAEPATAATRPTIPPPRYKIHRFNINQPISIVVATSTTDEQLKSLLWFFREKVRSHQFSDLGINGPTDTRRGKKGYEAGMLVVFRGQKCADEDFSNRSPCGYGSHDAASYQWGILRDDPHEGIDPDRDEAVLTSADGSSIRVFDHTDHWKPTIKTQPPRRAS